LACSRFENSAAARPSPFAAACPERRGDVNQQTWCMRPDNFLSCSCSCVSRHSRSDLG
jgi:hypothetical protein